MAAVAGRGTYHATLRERHGASAQGRLGPLGRHTTSGQVWETTRGAWPGREGQAGAVAMTLALTHRRPCARRGRECALVGTPSFTISVVRLGDAAVAGQRPLEVRRVRAVGSRAGRTVVVACTCRAGAAVVGESSCPCCSVVLSIVCLGEVARLGYPSGVCCSSSAHVSSGRGAPESSNLQPEVSRRL